MKVAIFGAGGHVGAAFVRHLANHNDVLAFKHADVDISNSQAVGDTLFNQQPSLVVNCAVLGVDACERNPSLAWSVNVAGARNLATIANDVGAQFIHFSSNYVFDGERSRDSSYTIDDPPNPINVYGETKLASERAVGAATPHYFIVRTSWVFGGKNNFLSAVPRSLLAGQKVRAITDVWASATYVCDLVPRVMEIVASGRYGTYHVANSGLCSYYEFAVEAADILGISDSKSAALIEPVTQRALHLRARRPYHTPMSCKLSEELGLAPLRDWRTALRHYTRETL